MTKPWVTAALALVAATLVVAGSSRTARASLGGESWNDRDLELAAADLALISSLDSDEELVDAAGGADAGTDGGHNPAAMGGLSLLIPGTGQLVQGEKRGYIYLLAELAFWGGFYVLNEQGLQEREDFKDFADLNWDYEGWQAWYLANCEGCTDCGYECRPLPTPEDDPTEFYEDIGKYSTYWRWWYEDGDEWEIDWDEYSDNDIAVRNDYWDMRQTSNLHLEQARYFLMAVLLNHVVSGIDAFLIAKGDAPEEGLSGGDVGIQFDVARGGGVRGALVARF